MRCALIGKPLGHSYSKIIHEKFGYYGYDLVELEENQLEKFVKEGKYDGFNVTIPYKTAIIGYLDKLDPIASEIGAVNTVVRTGGKRTATTPTFSAWRTCSKKQEYRLRVKTC